MRYAAAALCVAAVFAALPAQVQASACPSPPPVVQTASAVYGADANFEALDTYLPASIKDAPVILFAHGGGWTRGDKAQFRALGQTFAACGIAFIALNYPLAPQARADVAAADIDKAVKWTIDNAPAKGYARRKVFLMGHGAGAELVTLAALNPKLLTSAGVPAGSIAGVIALDGEAYDPSQAAVAAAADPAHYRQYAMAFGSDSAQWKQFDCSQFLTGADPRFLVVHGVDDEVARSTASQMLVAQLTRIHDHVTYLQPVDRDYSGVLVDMVREPNDPVLAAIVGFVSGT